MVQTNRIIKRPKADDAKRTRFRDTTLDLEEPRKGLKQVIASGKRSKPDVRNESMAAIDQ